MAPLVSFPDAVTRLAPVLGRIIGNSSYQLPIFRRQSPALDQINDSAVREISQTVQLALAKGMIAELHRPGAAIAGGLAARVLLDFGAAIDTVQHLNTHLGRRAE